MAFACTAGTRQSVVCHVLHLTLRHITPSVLPVAIPGRWRLLSSTSTTTVQLDETTPSSQWRASTYAQGSLGGRGDHDSLRAEVVQAGSDVFNQASTSSQAISSPIHSDVDKIIYLSPHERQTMVNRLTRYLARFQPLPSSSSDLLSHAADLKRMIRHFTPANFHHTKPDEVYILLLAWSGYLRVYEHLQSINRLPSSPLSSDNFNPLFIALSRVSPLFTIDQTGERWSTLSIPLVLEFMTATLHLKPTLLQLQILITQQSQSSLLSTSLSFHRKAPAKLKAEILEEQVFPTWNRRKELIQLVEEILNAGEGSLDGHIGECVNTCLDEADLIGFGPFSTEMARRLDTKVQYWGRKRDIIVESAKNTLRPRLQAWQETLHDSTSFPEVTALRLDKDEGRLVIFLLRDILLHPRLRRNNMPRTKSKRNSEGATPVPFDLDDPFDLLRILLEASAATGPRPSVSYGHDQMLYRGIIYARNSFYRQRQFDNLLALIDLLKSPYHSTSSSATTTQPLSVPLPGQIHASLLTTARDAQQLCRLMIDMYHLPAPMHRPPSIDRGKRRMLLHFAAEADDHHYSISSAEMEKREGDSDIMDIIQSSGWKGLLNHLYGKWGVGWPQSQWEKVINTKEIGDTNALEAIRKKNAMDYRLSVIYPHTMGQRTPGGHLNVRPGRD